MLPFIVSAPGVHQDQIPDSADLGFGPSVLDPGVVKGEQARYLSAARKPVGFGGRGVGSWNLSDYTHWSSEMTVTPPLYLSRYRIPSGVGRTSEWMLLP